MLDMVLFIFFASHFSLYISQVISVVCVVFLYFLLLGVDKGTALAPTYPQVR